MPKTLAVLIPGSGGEAWYWHRLEPELKSRGLTTIAVDLPSDDDSAGLEQYVSTAVDAAKHAAAAADAVIVIGQSMAGFVAPQVARELNAQELILVNAMIPRPAETMGEWFGSTGQAEAMADFAEEEGRQRRTEVDPVEHLLEDLPQPVKKEAFDRGEPTQSGTPFGDPWPESKWPDIPTRVVTGIHDRLFPAEFQRRLAKERLDVEVTTIDGGHLLALANPQGLAETITAD